MINRHDLVGMISQADLAAEPTNDKISDLVESQSLADSCTRSLPARARRRTPFSQLRAFAVRQCHYQLDPIASR